MTSIARPVQFELPFEQGKICTACKLWLPREAFSTYPHNDKPHLRARCKACTNALQRSKRAIEKPIKQFNRPYLDTKLAVMVKACPGCGIVSPLTTYTRGSSRCKSCRAAKRRWYSTANAERLREYWRRSRVRRPAALVRRYVDERDARRRGASRSEKVDRATVVARDGGICYLCGGTPVGFDLTLDHVIPLIRGGSHTYDNLRVACRRCNSRKNRMTYDEYKAAYPS